MAEEVGIVMTLYDKMSPTMKAMGNNTKAFDKAMQALEQTCAAYEKEQKALTADASRWKSALEASNKKVSEARTAYKKFGDELHKGILDEAIKEQEEYKARLKDTESAMNSSRKSLMSYRDELRKTGNSGGSEGSGASGLLKGLLSAGLSRQVGDAIAQAGGSFLSSAIGEPEARFASSVLSGAVSGGMMGAALGLPGIAIGALVGGLSGAISGGSEIFAARDDAFKSYVQDAAEAQISARDEAITSGSGIAGSREQKQLAFATLLRGDAAAGAFLGDVKAMAAATNYTYDEITGYAKSMVKPFGADRTLDMLKTLSDTSAALSLDSSDNGVLIAGLSRMQLTDKTTQEYLNYFSERGIDVYEALSQWGDAATVAGKVSSGAIRGSDAVEALLSYMQEQYGGLSERMASTYEGMMGNLEDAEANAEEAYGIGYNETRKKGIQAQTEWLAAGAQDEANRAIGAWQAQLENEKERYIREAVNDAMEGKDYQRAKAEDDAAEMGRILMQAKVRGMDEYNASKGAQEALAAEKALVEGIRSDAGMNSDYWDAGYERGQWYTRGLAAALAGNASVTRGERRTGGGASNYHRYAYGLDRVPYDDFPALLHEGERVQTAAQARAADAGAGSVNLNLNGPVTVREEADLDKLARKFANEVRRAALLAEP